MHRAWLTSDVASGFNESIYYHDPVSTRHTDAAAALKAVYGGELGQPYFTEYIFDEAITLTRTRTRSFPRHIG